jgi:hypothetical protein
MKDFTRRKETSIRVRLTIAEHNALMRSAVDDGMTISETVRRRLKLHTPKGKETGNAGAQPVSGR